MYLQGLFHYKSQSLQMYRSKINGSNEIYIGRTVSILNTLSLNSSAIKGQLLPTKGSIKKPFWFRQDHQAQHPILYDGQPDVSANPPARA